MPDSKATRVTPTPIPPSILTVERMASRANQKGRARVEKVASPVVEEEDPVSTSKSSPKSDSTTGPVDPEHDAPLVVVPPLLSP